MASCHGQLKVSGLSTVAASGAQHVEVGMGNLLISSLRHVAVGGHENYLTGQHRFCLHFSVGRYDSRLHELAIHLGDGPRADLCSNRWRARSGIVRQNDSLGACCTVDTPGFVAGYTTFSHRIHGGVHILTLVVDQTYWLTLQP